MDIRDLFDIGLGASMATLSFGAFALWMSTFYAHRKKPGANSDLKVAIANAPMAGALLDLGDDVTDLFDFWDALISQHVDALASFEPYQILRQWAKGKGRSIDEIKAQKMINDLAHAWDFQVMQQKLKAQEIPQKSFDMVKTALGSLQEQAQDAFSA